MPIFVTPKQQESSCKFISICFSISGIAVLIAQIIVSILIIIDNSIPDLLSVYHFIESLNISIYLIIYIISSTSLFLNIFEGGKQIHKYHLITWSLSTLMVIIWILVITLSKLTYNSIWGSMVSSTAAWLSIIIYLVYKGYHY